MCEYYLTDGCLHARLTTTKSQQYAAIAVPAGLAVQSPIKTRACIPCTDGKDGHSNGRGPLIVRIPSHLFIPKEREALQCHRRNVEKWEARSVVPSDQCPDHELVYTILSASSLSFRGDVCSRLSNASPDEVPSIGAVSPEVSPSIGRGLDCCRR